MPSEQEIEDLLEVLCVEMGFCLSPRMNARLAKFPPKSPAKFVDAFVKAEGLNPALMEKSLYQSLLSSVEAVYTER